MKNIVLYSAFLIMTFSCHSPKSDKSNLEKSDSLNNVGQTAYYSQVYEQDTFITYTYMPKNEVLQLYWKDESNNILQNFPNLISFTAQQNKELLFAMNGGMYMKDGKINPLFTQNSSNINIRNGVGLSSDNKTIFVISKIPVNFYDFAAFFQELGCVNALYLDGVISKIYIKDKTTNLSSDNFGVIIGITKK